MRGFARHSGPDPLARRVPAHAHDVEANDEENRSGGDLKDGDDAQPLHERCVAEVDLPEHRVDDGRVLASRRRTYVAHARIARDVLASKGRLAAAVGLPDASVTITGTPCSPMLRDRSSSAAVPRPRSCRLTRDRRGRTCGSSAPPRGAGHRRRDACTTMYDPRRSGDERGKDDLRRAAAHAITRSGRSRYTAAALRAR